MLDEKLLRDYVRTQSDVAFATLMERHLPMVYAVCLRETGNRVLAEDATQAVFIVLARRAARLKSSRVLPSWLYQTARLTARALMRRERLRRHKEREGVPREYPAFGAPSLVNLLLMEAIDTLKTRDRDAIVLRYFTGLSVSETAESLGISESAAQMRLSRALEKLLTYLAHRDAGVTGVGLVALLTALPDRQASAALLSHSTAIAASGQSGSYQVSLATYQLAQGVSRIMAITNLKIAAVCCGVLFFAGESVAVFAHRDAPKVVAITGNDGKNGIRAATVSKTIIVIDPGHGGVDSGTAAPGHQNEKSLALAISTLTATSLMKRGYTVHLTRSNDSTLSVAERAQISRRLHATVFVSVHVDKSEESSDHSGSTVYYHRHDRKGELLATYLSGKIAHVTGHPSNGTSSDTVHFADGFGVLRMQTAPCALVECGFLNNATDIRYLESKEGEQELANGIADGISSYLVAAS